MRRVNAYFDRLPLGLNGLLSGLFVFAADAGIFYATGGSAGTAIKTGIAAGVGGGFGCAASRERWRQRRAGRFAKSP